MNSGSGAKQKKKRGFGRTIARIAAVLLVLFLLYAGFVYCWNRRLSLTKVQDYLYEVNCEECYYGASELAFELFKPKAGSCTVVWTGRLFGRNFDEVYDESAEFVVHNPATETRHASVGITNTTTGYSRGQVEGGSLTPETFLIPLIMVDGINDAGVVCCVNMVPPDDTKPTTGTNPGGKRLVNCEVVRYVLDYANSAKHAVELLRELDIYSITIGGEHLEFHYMIADAEDCFIAEVYNNELRITEGEPVMTNFFACLDGYTSHATGIERYDYVTERYDPDVDEDGMFRLLEDVWYTKSYPVNEGDPVWYSEYYEDYSANGYEYYSLSSPREKLDEYIAVETEWYLNRARDAKTYQSVHTSVYDIENRTLSVIVQENGTVYEFALDR